MDYYAELDKAGIVIQVIPGVDHVLKDGEAIYSSITNTVWKRSVDMTNSENGTFRKNPAVIGSTFDPTVEPDGAFIDPPPYPSWSLDKDYKWQSPVPYPNDGKRYVWTENTRTWVLTDTKR